MKPLLIGILSGAGPFAGVSLLERVLSLSGTLYECHKDADFPEIFFLSFPFADMLSSERNEIQIRKELSSC